MSRVGHRNRFGSATERARTPGTALRADKTIVNGGYGSRGPTTSPLRRPYSNNGKEKTTAGVPPGAKNETTVRRPSYEERAAAVSGPYRNIFSPGVFPLLIYYSSYRLTNEVGKRIGRVFIA